MERISDKNNSAIPSETTVAKETVAPAADLSMSPLLRRAFMFLEDGDWRSADKYAERVLDLEPECAAAYLVKLCAELRERKREDLKDCPEPFDTNKNYQKALRFGDEILKAELNGYIEQINIRRFQEIQAKEEVDRLETESKAKRMKRITALALAIAAIAVMIAFIVVLIKGIIPNIKYNAAIDLKEAGRHEEAIAAFAELGDHKDSVEQIEECEYAIKDIQYDKAIALKEAGRYEEAIAAFAELAVHKDSVEQIEECEYAIKDIQYDKAIALKEAGRYEEAIAAFAELGGHKDSAEQIEECNATIHYNESVAAFNSGDIDTAICYYLQSGSIQKNEEIITAWREKNAQTISTGYTHTIGLKSDGTVVAVGSNEYGKCNVSGWKDIVAVCAGGSHTVGLKSDGTVVAVGNNNSGQCDVSGWKDIVAISAGWDHTVGLKSDGMVIAAGYKDDDRCNVSGWKDIEAISAGHTYTIGLKSDGMVVAVGSNTYGRCNVRGWRNIKLPKCLRTK